MSPLTEQLQQSDLVNRVINEEQLKRLVAGSDARRYGLVNRALEAGELKRIRRGVYMLPNRYRSVPVNSFALAQSLAPGSYVSLETALEYHGWIPEAVYTVASIVPGRKSWRLVDQEFDAFSFHPLAIEPGYFLELIEREQQDTQVMLVAQPARALLDLICLRKQEWQGIGWLTEGMRIDIEQLQTIGAEQLEILKCVYKQKRVRQFIESLAKELDYD